MVTRTLVPTDVRWAQVVITDKADLRGLLRPSEIKSRAERLGLTKRATKVNDCLYKEFRQATENQPGPASEGGTGATANTGGERTMPEAVPEAMEGVAPPSTSASEVAKKPTKPPLEKLQQCLDDGMKTSESLIDSVQIQSVYQMYAVLLTDQTSDTSIQTSYAYGKLTSVTFGLGVGAIVDFNLNQQVKISDGTLVADTPNGVMTSVNLYWSVLGGYDESTLAASWAEKRPRLVLGAVLTPDFGGFVGIALPLAWVRDFRSFTLNGGYALMLATVPARNAQVGDSGSMATTKRGALGGWFLAVGYSF